MPVSLPSAEADFRVEFYDVDSLKIVWHGNYPRYLEIGRCALLDLIGYGYNEMEASGYAWPVVDLRIKYVRPLRFLQEARIRASLLDYENRIHIGYLIFDSETGDAITKAESVQMAIDMKSGESLFTSPPYFVQLIENWLKKAERS